MTITRSRKRRLTWRIAGDMLLSGYGLTFDPIDCNLAPARRAWGHENP